MSDWIDVEIELPPCDGKYEVTNRPDLEFSEEWSHHCGSANYDGIGFFYVEIYRPVKFWRHLPILEKRYGKVSP